MLTPNEMVLGAWNKLHPKDEALMTGITDYIKESQRVLPTLSLTNYSKSMKL